MTVDDCMQYTYDVASFGIEMLVIRIYEAYTKHSNNEKLSKLDRFLLGLRYSEFLATGTSDYDYYMAEMKRQSCLRKLGITPEEINTLLYNTTGLA